MSLISPRLVQPALPPEYEWLLEIREEFLDLQNREALLAIELENMPMNVISSSSEADSDSAPNSESWKQFCLIFYLKTNIIPPFLMHFSGRWVGPPFLCLMQIILIKTP